MSMLFRATALAVACLSWGPATAEAPTMVPPQERVPVEIPTAADFGAQPVFADPQLSPDGRRIVARAQRDGRALALVLDADGDERRTRQYSIPDSHQLEWVRWAGNDRLLVSLSGRMTVLGVAIRNTRVSTIDLASGKQISLGPRNQGIDGDDLVHVDPEGRFVLLSAQETIFDYPSVYRIDLGSGRSERIVKGRKDVWEWFADPAGVVRAGMEVRGEKWWLIYRSSDAGAFRRIERRSDDTEQADMQQLAPFRGGDAGYAVANSPSGRFAVYRYDFHADRLGQLIYEHPVVDVESLRFDASGELLGVHYIDDRPETAWLDPELKRLQARVDRTLPGAINQIVSLSADKNRALIWSASATDPGRYFLYDRSANQMAAFAIPYEQLEGKTLAPMEPIRYRARDGTEIRGYLTVPHGRARKALPLVVMPHGGPFARDQWGYDPWTQYLASRGYAVLQPNFRGSTGFGRAFVEMGNGAWGRGMQDDIDDGVRWLAGSGTIDPRRVCIMGASFGGYAAMWGAVRNPDLYRCAISFAGISDVSEMLRYDRKRFAAPRYFRDWRERVRGDSDFQLAQISPINMVERMTVPILIAHGEKDDNVPVSQSRRLHEALTRLKRPHEFRVYPGEGHNFADPANATDFLNRVGAFLALHNPS